MRICFIRHPGNIHARRWIEYFAKRGHEMHVLYFEGDFDMGSEVDKYFPGLAQLENAHIHCVRDAFRESRIIKLIRSMLGKEANDGSISSSQEEKTKGHIRLIGYLIVNIAKFPYAIIDTIVKVKSLRKVIKEIAPDIVHAHSLNYYGWFGALSGFHPFIATAWGSDILINPKRSFVSKVRTKYVLKKADLITCDGENLVAGMVRLGANSEKIKLIYFGVDMEKFSPEHREEELREKLRAFNSPVVISIRSLTPLYDVESLVKAVPLVLEQIPEVKFIIAGDGRQRDYLKNLAVSLGVSDSVRFVGMIPHDELPKYLASADIYVSTSLSDSGLAVSTSEAMACGLPVVITDFGDNSKWVEDGVNGFLVPLKSPEALASRIVHLLHNENDRIKFGQANRQMIEEKANYREEMGKAEKLYEELIERYEK